jgi:nucleoside-diphosphate-sugar epimerase
VTGPGDGGLVFLTGATGFIGGRLASALHGRGYRLRCLVRSPARAGRLRELGAELVTGDAADAAVLERALSGAVLAYHVAGMYAMSRVDAGEMERTNVGGTVAFLEAVRRSGVPRAVHVSSIVALGPVSGEEPGQHVAWEGPYPSVYHRTKAAAHAAAEAAVREGLPVIIVCPAFVYGPGDEGPPAHFIADVLRHRMPGLTTRPTTFSYVYVDDVVDGLVAAGERGRIGATYVLSGEAATVNHFARRVADAGGTWLTPLRFPPALARLTGSALDAVSRLTGVRMPISRELAQSGASGERWVHSHTLATRDLGYAPRGLADGVPATVRDVRERFVS